MSACQEQPNEAVSLTVLRADWPEWQFQIERRLWTAALGSRAIVWASSPAELQEWLVSRSEPKHRRTWRTRSGRGTRRRR
jgi:hypothetical protein